MSDAAFPLPPANPALQKQTLFGRTLRITLNKLQILASSQPGTPALAATFRIHAHLKTEPNTAEVKVWNLSRESRSALESGAVTTLLEAGYGSDLHALFFGNMRAAMSQREGPEIITTIASGDGEAAFPSSRISLKIPAEATGPQIMTAVGNVWLNYGIGVGNLASAAGLCTATFGGAARTLFGSLTRVMTDVCTMNGLEWSIQNNNLQILEIGAMLKPPATAVRLSSSSGLIGSPSVDTKGVLKCKALIQPGLFPGLPLVMDSEFVKGNFRIEDADFAGATWDQEWYVEITGRSWSKTQ
jgi:hypothetical protein